MTVLNKIITNRQRLLSEEKQVVSISDVRSGVEERIESGYKPPEFLNSLKQGEPFLIAEIKKASPSKGIIRKDFDIANIAKTYHGSTFVDAISILTEPAFFQGCYEYIEQAGSITNKPILMKDFIIDPYQIYKGFLLGASAILVIASIMEDAQIKEFIRITRELNMNILFEAHTASEYRRALNFDLNLIGINNRDLKTFITDINNTIKIIEEVGKPDDRTIISESGIHSKEDIMLLQANGTDGFLIGERFMKNTDIDKAITDLFGDRHEKTTC